jgi:hypothetical protein
MNLVTNAPGPPSMAAPVPSVEPPKTAALAVQLLSKTVDLVTL